MPKWCILYMTLKDLTFSIIDMFTVIAKAMNLMKAKFNEDLCNKVKYSSL